MVAATDLELSILRTICWFSVFDLPLSTFEIYKWLLTPARAYDLFEVDLALEQSEWLQSRIDSKDGLFFLKMTDVKNTFLNRHRRFLDAIRKFRKLCRATYFFQLLPGVRAVCAVNTLAWWHTTAESDIDLFIVTSPKHIWSSRLLLVLPFLLTGLRPQHSQATAIKDPYCFSFFCTTEALQFENIKWNEDDHYLAYWVKSMVPMFDRGDVIEQIEAINKWSDHVLPNAWMRSPHPVHKPIALFSFPIQWSFLEPVCRAIQRHKFPSVIRDLANQDSRVVITDDMLKFHENDRRVEFIQAFRDAYEHAL